MPPKKPESQQPRKKSATVKKVDSAGNPAKKVLRKTGKSATTQRTRLPKTENPHPEMHYPGPSMALSEELRERIAQRAFEIHQRRGGHHGSDWEDWLQAEREILLNQPPHS
jgi:hypothetical protein